MNKDQVQGNIKETKGSVKEVAGDVSDNTQMELEGNI